MPAQKRGAAPPQKPQGGRGYFDKSHLIILASLSLISLVLLVMFWVVIPRGQVQDAIRGPQAFQASQSRELEGNQARRTYPLADKLVLVSREELVCEDYQGRQIFAVALDMNRPSVQVMDNFLLVGDREGSQVVVINPHGLVFESYLDGGFVKGALHKDGFWAFLDEQSDDKALVHLVSPEGKRILTLSFAKSGNALNLKFTPDGRYLDILLLNTSSSNMKTLLRRYDLEGGLVAQKVVEAYNSLFYGLEHDVEGLPIIYSSNQALKLDFEAEESILEVELSSILAVYAQASQLLILGNDQPDAYYGLYSYGEDKGLQELADQLGRASHIRLSPDRSKLFYVTDNLLHTIDLANLSSGPAQALDGEILAYNFYAGKEVNVVTSHSAHLVPWK
ncbi:MAG: DUF5711 family protein [Eubacteriales bacterium]|nr:DUF5711 family protein [Eubacteriales bacterium]